MDLHHLHTVNYDRKPNNERVTATPDKVYSKEHHSSNKTHKNKSNREEKIIRSLHDSNPRQEYNQTNQRCRNTGSKVTNSKSKVHQHRVKDIVEKIPSIRTFSLEDVGKGKRLKKSSSTKLIPKPKTRGKNRRSKQNRIRFKEIKESQDDIKVLYTSERVADRNSKKQSTKKKLHTRTSSAELFSTPSVSKIRSNLYLYYQTCKQSGLLTPTRRKKKPVSKKPNIIQATYPLMIQSYKRAVSSTKCFAPKPYHDTLNDSSRHCKIDNTTQQSESQCVADLPKSVVSKNCGGDARVVCSQCQCAPVFAEPACVNEENNAIRRFFKIFKKSVMFVLLCLTLIAWSPCIIIMFIFWYIISLLLPDAEEAKEVMPSCPKRKNSFFSRLIHRVPRLYNRIMRTFKSVKKSFQLDDEPARPPNLQSDKKYELYYTANKGWLRTEASKESQHKPCRNEKSVKFWDSQNPQKCEPRRLKDTSCTCQWPECKNPCSIHKSPCTSKSAPCFRRSCKKNSPPGPYRAVLLSGPHQKIKLNCWKPPRRQLVPMSRLYKQPYHCRNVIDKGAKTCPEKYAVLVPQACNLNQEELAKICKKKKIKSRAFFKKCCKTVAKEAVGPWDSGVECTGNMYIHTLTNKPCFWMYECCPNSYPAVLAGCQMCQSCFKMLMYALASCVWCPLFACAYCCYLLCCVCFDC